MTTQPLLHVLSGQAVEPPPIWFMRQAGRILPEYRKTREQAGSFLNLCYDPQLASAVTLQPVERFDVDAAILFADILLIPQSMGQKLWFEVGEGPRLAPEIESNGLQALAKTPDFSLLNPIYETVRQTREKLNPAKSLIGFAGAPWTVATYMLHGKSSKDPSALRSLYYQQPDMVLELIERLTTATITYLDHQIKAGVDVIQIFESWAQGLPAELLEKLCLAPTAKIATSLKQKHPNIKIIAFPRGAGSFLAAYGDEPSFDGISIDTSVPWQWAKDVISPKKVVQGGMDPLLVRAGGPEMERAALKLKRIFANSPYIFNLGHGFDPGTDPTHVSHLISLIRQPL